MSYEILYDRKFIKTSRGVLPMILSGSNNCTEFTWDSRGRNRERRERHWWCWTPRGLLTKDLPMRDYLTRIEEICREYTEPHQLFMRGSEWMMTSQWRKWFENGCKTAKTLNEYLHQNRGQSFEGVVLIYEKGESESKEQLRECLHNTEELENWIDRANALVATMPEKESYVCLRFTDNEPLKNSTSIEGAVVVKTKGGGYLEKYEKGRSLSFTADPECAIIFESVSDAWEKLGTGWKDLRFVKPPSLKPKNYVLRFTEGRFGYLFKKTRSSLYSTGIISSAKRFETKGEATRYALKTAERFNIGPTIELIDIESGTSELIKLK